MDSNRITDVRPDSTFDKFVPQTDSQRDAMTAMQTIADQLVAASDYITESGISSPFNAASMFVLAGGPGRGKTHLLESVINEVGQKAPGVLSKMYLCRNKLYSAMAGGLVYEGMFDDCPIVLLDDLFSNVSSPSKLHPSTEIAPLMNFIAWCYEKRVLTIATSNFSFLEEILPRIKQADPVGRIYSRCQEVMVAHAGEVVIDGPDYREILAQEALARRKRPGGGLPKLTFGGGS